MPASRRARAMILAPPSRPGLATTTRILRAVAVLTARSLVIQSFACSFSGHSNEKEQAKLAPDAEAARWWRAGGGGGPAGGAGGGGGGGATRLAPKPATVARKVTARATRRRPRRSKRRTCQPSSRAIAASGGSGLTATGLPTARSIGRSESESE